MVYDTVHLQMKKIEKKTSICSILCVKLYQNSTNESGKSGYRTKKVFLQLCVWLRKRGVITDTMGREGDNLGWCSYLREQKIRLKQHVFSSSNFTGSPHPRMSRITIPYLQNQAKFPACWKFSKTSISRGCTNYWVVGGVNVNHIPYWGDLKISLLFGWRGGCGFCCIYWK